MSDINWGLLDTNGPTNVLNAFMSGRRDREAQAAKQREEAALQRRAQVGQRAASGDLAGAKQSALSGGDFELAQMVEKMDDQQRAEAKGRAEQFAAFGFSLKQMPYEQRKARILAAAPILAKSGLPMEMISAFDPTDEAIDAQLASTMSLKEQLEMRKPIAFKSDEDLYVPNVFGAPGGGQAAPQSPQAAPQGPAPAAAAPQGDAAFEAFKAALIKQESGGRPGIPGPPTQYGTANGLMQVLDSTGQQVAKQIGVPWRPELMRDKSPEGAAYQELIGTAYAREAWEAAGGDPRVAAMYYHGGPNRAIWGPKTRAHGDAVVRKMGGVQQTAALGGGGQDVMQGGGGGQAPDPGVEIPGYTMLRRGTPKAAEQWIDIAPGVQQNTRTGKKETAPGGPRPDQSFSQESQLRTQFGNQPAVKDLAAVKAHIGIIGSIAGKAQRGEPVTAADDLALIFAFMKMLDPGSVVREGEFANAQNTGGIPDRVMNAYNRALKGTRLSDNQRAEFFKTAATAMDSYTESYVSQAERYRGLADGYGLKADNIAPAPKRNDRRPQQRPAAQQVRPPQAALATLKEGAKTTFGNGQVWTLRNGKPVRIN